MKESHTEAAIMVSILNFEELIHCIAELSEAVQEGAFSYRASRHTESAAKMRAWFDYHYTKRWYPPEGWSKRSIDKELAKVAAEFERQCNAGEILTRQEQKDKAAFDAAEAAKILTLKQYGEQVFMPAKVITCSENTRSSFQGNLNNWIYPALGNAKMPEITPAMISALLLSMQSQDKAHGTVIKVYTILISLFQMAYMEDAIDRNPMDKVKRPAPRMDEIKPKEAEAYTVEELRYILECLDAEPLKWRALIRLLIDSGMRRGECCGLKWENVDFKACQITIAGNLCYTPQKGVYLDTPKNGKTRTIDVDPDVMHLLWELRQEQASKALSAYVFTQLHVHAENLIQGFATFEYWKLAIN